MLEIADEQQVRIIANVVIAGFVVALALRGLPSCRTPDATGGRPLRRRRPSPARPLPHEGLGRNGPTAGAPHRHNGQLRR